MKIEEMLTALYRDGEISKDAKAQILTIFSTLEAKVKELEKDKVQYMTENIELQKSIDELNAGYEFIKDKNASLKSQVEGLKYTIRLSYGWLKEYSNDADNGTHAKRILHNAILSWKPDKE